MERASLEQKPARPSILFAVAALNQQQKRSNGFKSLYPATETDLQSLNLTDSFKFSTITQAKKITPISLMVAL